MSKNKGGRPPKYKHKFINIDELIPYVNNTRTHTDKQITQVASSIKEFGFTNPVLVDDENGIIAGHCRVIAAKKLNYTEVPIIVLSGLSEAQRKAYIIADNQLALNAGWDLDLLKIEFDSLKELDFNLDLLGFEDDFTIDVLNNVDEVDYPELADGEKEPYQQKTFTLHDEQVDIVDDAIMKARANPLSDTGLNDNSNGNALSFICDDWLRVQNGIS